MSSGASVNSTGPGTTSRSVSVAGPLAESTVASSVQRSPRLSLPQQYVLSTQKRPSLQPPPAPAPAPPTQLTRKATIVFYIIVAQFFLSISCLFWAGATAITLYSFELYCLFGSVSFTGSLAMVTAVFLVVSAQVIASAVGIGAFEGKKQVQVKIHLLIVYLAINVMVIFLDVGLIFFCASGGVLAFFDEMDCIGEGKHEESVALKFFLVLFGATAFLHVITSISVSLVLCYANELFTKSSKSDSTPAPATPTSPTKEENSSPSAPPVKRFSKV